MKTAGIVLAAGASQRMGFPKALLRGADGVPLAARQARLLRAGGCEPVVVVVGSEAERVRAALPEDVAVVENPRWAEGRATSLQAGLRAVMGAGAGGFLVLPVDAVGVRVETVRRVLAVAAGGGAEVWRPVCGGVKGNVLWVGAGVAGEVLGLGAGERVDVWARGVERAVEVGDEGVLRNVNTPEEWAEVEGG